MDIEKMDLQQLKALPDAKTFDGSGGKSGLFVTLYKSGGKMRLSRDLYLRINTGSSYVKLSSAVKRPDPIMWMELDVKKEGKKTAKIGTDRIINACAATKGLGLDAYCGAYPASLKPGLLVVDLTSTIGDEKTAD